MRAALGLDVVFTMSSFSAQFCSGVSASVRA